MTDRNYYQICSPNIIHESIEGEVVIVDLDKGFYFSLRGTAAEIWADIVAGASAEQIAQQLMLKYTGEDQKIESAVINLISDLLKENIIVPAVIHSKNYQPFMQKHETTYNETSEEFSIPVLEKYSDMADLLLLDPIHEVDETGWPNIAPDPDEIEK